MKKPNIEEVDGGIIPNDTLMSTLDKNRHTEEIHDIITKVPSWILRWGMALFLGILLMTFSISALVRFPDTIKTNLKIEAQDTPVALLAPTQSQIMNVLVKAGDEVKKGQQLIQITGTAGSSAAMSVLIAPKSGIVAFVAIVQSGDILRPGQQILNIHPKNERYFGVIQIPQVAIAKVNKGQEVLVTLANYPTEDYGQLKGQIIYLADEPLNGFFAAKVNFTNSQTLKKRIILKTWMTGQAQIITENVSLQKRIYNGIINGLQ